MEQMEFDSAALADEAVPLEAAEEAGLPHDILQDQGGQNLGGKMPVLLLQQPAIAQWIADLGSESYAVRESAADRLGAAGMQAVPDLAKAIESDNLEVSWRALTILKGLILSHEPSIQEGTIAELEKLSTSSNREIAALAGSALTSYYANRHDQTVIQLRQLGATVSHGRGRPTNVRLGSAWKGGDDGVGLLSNLNQLQSLNLTSSSLTDAALAHVARLTELQKLYLGDTQIKGPGLAYLESLPELNYLSLTSLELDEQSLQYVARLKKLEQLGLDETPITDAALVHLRDLTNLKVLWLNRTNITDAGLAELQGLSSLNKLVLTGTRITGSGLQHIKKLPNLNYLSLQHVKLADDEARHLAGLARLETLGLDDTNITDAALTHLRDLKNLKTLWLTNTRVTDTGLKQLQSLSQLEKLYIQGTQITNAAAAEFNKTLPQCKLVQ
jgi:hypothetical protein